MKLSLCTISFRHQLISLEEIARWAMQHHFNGIELWGVHAKSLGQGSDYNREWLRERDLRVPMLSDYLPVGGDKSVAIDKASDLCALARRWGAQKIRTFAGNRASDEVNAEERLAWVRRLRDLCEVVESFGIRLIVETHPNTLADTLASTLQLIDEVDHPALKLNFDVIHVWEGGTEPIEAFRKLLPLVDHMHLKNVLSRDWLGVFSPQNVYAPSGERGGMTRLFDGAYDFETFLHTVKAEFPFVWNEMDASLEWFGSDVLLTLEQDGLRLLQFDADASGRTNRPRTRTVSLS